MATEQKSGVGSAFDLLPKSFDIVKKNWQVFAVVNIFGILSAVAALFTSKKPNQVNLSSPIGDASGYELGAILGLGAVIGLILLVASLYLYAMSTILEVKSAAGKKPTVSELFESAKKYWLRLIGLAIVSAFIVLVGLLLLIIPGVIAFGRVVMAPFLMVDKDLSIGEALKQSNAMGKKFPGKVWAAIGVMILISIAAGILGEIPRIGLILGVSLSIAYSLVVVLRYQQLKTR